MKKNESSDSTNHADPPKLPFVTTSDLLSRLNQNLSELSHGMGDNHDDNNGCQPRFELQKRLPDGSTVPATAADKAYSDLQTKIQQSAAFVAQLLPSDQVRWAEQQRQIGNAYFERADYRAAMDIYLTCLVVKGSSEKSTFIETTLVPVLNNLAQCTLQLGMLKKTIEFCDIALVEIRGVHDKDDAQVIDPLAKCKIHFKRAKARRLTGQYKAAQEDLNLASLWLDKKEEIIDDERSSEMVPYRTAIQKEVRLLETSKLQARKNRDSQKRALQKAWQPQNDIINEGHGFVPSAPEIKTPRQYSSLQARKKEPNQEPQPEARLSHFQYYCLMVVRVTELLLVWLGDEETIKKVKERTD
jgi:tetratricopeptide (TPR) repeat protein